MYGRPALGNALLHAGRLKEAERRFREAEEMQRLGQPQFPFLYWLQGFQYCDLLLAPAERAAWRKMLSPGPASGEDAGAPADASALECLEVANRATQTLNWALTDLNGGPLYPALDRLTLFRAAFYPAVLEGAAIDNTTFDVDEAVAGLRSRKRSPSVSLAALGCVRCRVTCMVHTPTLTRLGRLPNVGRCNSLADCRYPPPPRALVLPRNLISLEIASARPC